MVSRNSDKAKRRFIFGPVSSRRLGLSLGIDLVPAKTCSHDCIYCEVGPTTRPTVRRDEYIPTGEIEAELNDFFAEPFCTPDCFTITGSGEPTLHSGLGRIIRLIKEKSPGEVVLLTNATTIGDPDVRAELAPCDIVVPSLDAVGVAAWRRINRPAPGCPGPDEVIEGLVALRREFPGEIWLEILLVKGINDADNELEALSRAAERINPDRIQLNTVVRPPSSRIATSLSAEELDRVAVFFHGKAEVIIPPALKRGSITDPPKGDDRIIELVQRRPCPAAEISAVLGLDEHQTATILAALVKAGRIKVIEHQNERFYTHV